MKKNLLVYLAKTTTSFNATTRAAAPTNAMKFPIIAVTYVVTTPKTVISSSPATPPTSNVIAATRNAVLFFLGMFKKPTISPRITNAIVKAEV